MRTTEPSLRRRNYLLRKSHREWLTRRDDSDGEASGEESDDDKIPLRRPTTRPASITPQGMPSGGFKLVTGGVASPGAGNSVLPVSTVAAEEVVDGAVTSASDSDGVESGNSSDSGSEESGDETSVAPPTATPPPAVVPPALAAPTSPEVVQPLPAPTTSTAQAIPPPPTTAAATTTTAATLPPPALAPVQTGTSTTTPTKSPTNVVALPAVTETTAAGVQTIPLPGQTTATTRTSTDTQTVAAGLPTLPTSPSIGQAPLSTTLKFPSADQTPLPESEQVANPDNALGAVATEQGGMNPGAAAGIVIGVLALIGIMVAASFMWRKWRNNGKRLSSLPLFFSRSEKGSGPEMAYGGATMERDTAPILAPPNMAHNDKKTNSEMMDALMQATFKAEGGYNRDSEAGTFGKNGGPGFMNETTYTALAGPPTPAVAPNGPGKPVSKWLDGVRTPHQSGAPTIRTDWPVSEYASGPPPGQPTPGPGQTRPVAPWQQDDLAVGRPPMPDFLPPQPAFQRDPRYTTTTTTTSTESSDVRWG